MTNEDPTLDQVRDLILEIVHHYSVETDSYTREDLWPEAELLAANIIAKVNQDHEARTLYGYCTQEQLEDMLETANYELGQDPSTAKLAEVEVLRGALKLHKS